MSYTSGLTRSGGMRGGFESFSDIASEASVASQWTLEELKHEGKNFLLDKQTSIVYRDTDDNQWPEPVGKLVGGRIQFRSRQGAGQLFEALDRLLKERRVKFSQLFREYDADGSGGLDANELSRLVTELLPNVTSSEQRYFRAMIDTDGDGVVTQEEFLSSAKECMEAEAKAKARDSTDVMDVLQRMSNWLAGHKADAKRLFNQCDVRRSGHLEPAELLKFFRAAVPSMSPKQLRFLMSHVHHVDQSGDGTYAFAELMQTLRAVELRTPNAQQSKYTGFGTTPPPGGGYAPSVPSPRPTTPMSPLGAGGAATSPYDWTLQELRHTDGRTYLLDAQTSLVYSQMTQQAGGWPKVIGKLEGGRLVSVMITT